MSEGSARQIFVLNSRPEHEQTWHTVMVHSIIGFFTPNRCSVGWLSCATVRPSPRSKKVRICGIMHVLNKGRETESRQTTAVEGNLKLSFERIFGGTSNLSHDAN